MAEETPEPREEAMSNVIQFPGDRQCVTVEEVLERLTAAVKAGEVQYLMFTTMGPDTNCKTAMTTIPAHCAVYMNQLQRLSIEELMRDRGMIP